MRAGGCSGLCRAVSGVLILVPLASCATLSGYPARPGAAANDAAAMKAYFASDVVDRYHGADAARGGQDQRHYRDAVVNGRITALDVGYADLVRALQATDTAFGIGTDWTVLALNALGATVGGAVTKQALAAASAGIVGAKASVDRNLFYQKTLPALVAQMNASRKAVLTDLRAGLARPIDDYPLEQAIDDTNRYYWAGTLMGAVTSVAQQAGAAEAASQVKLDEIRRDAAFKATYDSRAAIVARIDKLGDAAVEKLALMMQIPLGHRSDAIRQAVQLADPTTLRFTDPARARYALKRWAVQETGGSDAFKEWTDALAAVE